MYFSERGNPDEEMADNYKTIPDAMWVTLLNLSGESPLCHYSTAGQQDRARVMVRMRVSSEW